MSTILDVVRQLVSQLLVFLALLLITSAVHKALRFRRARNATHELAGLNLHVASAAVMVAGLWESTAALLLWLPSTRFIGALLAAGLLAIYLALIANAVFNDHRSVECGCSFGSARRVLGTFEAVRNSCLVISALLIALFASSGVSAVSGSDLLPGLALLIIYYAIDEVMGIRSTAGRVVR